jgi:hypothetical protein
MKRRHKWILGGTLCAAIIGLAVGQVALEAVVSTQTVEAPRFEVDPYWPKPLPNNWVMGTVIGVGTDSRDHVFLVHRGNINPTTEGGADQSPAISDCCRAAPPVLEFDPEGNLVNAWGGEDGPGYSWPGSNHGIAVDHMDNIWIGGNGGQDSHIVKFTRDGQFLAQYGEPMPGVDSHAPDRFAGVAKITIDAGANEAYISDGYRNRRVAVLDVDTGEMLRYWGAYGNDPIDDYTYTDTRQAGTGWSADADPQLQFRTPVHCAEPTDDGLVYVCDRPNNRVQVFTKDGEYVDEAFYEPMTLGDGSTWDIAFSRDDEQRWIYLADGKNSRIRIVDRQTLEEVSTIGSGGRYPGQFQAVHSIATDSQGNIFITETYEGRRIQKFVFQGVGQVARHQGSVWPSR